jgi:hypothetical protein
VATYANVGDVRGRIPYRTIDATSQPSEVQVEKWIDEAGARAEGTLLAAGISIPTAAGPRLILKNYIVDYAEGRTRMAYAASGGDGGNDDGKDLVESFKEWILDIAEDSQRWAAIFGSGSVDSDALLLRSHVTNNPDGESISDGDFDPVFTRDEQW